MDRELTQLNTTGLRFYQFYRDTRQFGLPAVSTALCVIGTFANLTSLAYFIKKKDKTLGDKLLMLLNSVDLLLCICATLLSAITSYLDGHENTAPEDLGFVIMAITVLYLLLIDGTAYVTCLLSVTRAIGIVSPFYQIRGKLLVILGIIVFVVSELSQLPVLLGTDDIDGIDNRLLAYSRLAMPLMVLFTVLCATILAVYKLTRADLQGATENVSRNNRKATWTVVILSALFLVFNSILLGVMFQHFIRKDFDDYGIVTLIRTAFFLVIPLNSSLNPIVYLTRISDMRQFFIQNFQKFCHST